jgi:NOL1/NOP2/fmu family ribosome biogenesis protein
MTLKNNGLTYFAGLTSYAAKVAKVTISDTGADNAQICTDCLRPTIMGPNTVAPPKTSTNSVEIRAEWIAGMTKTFAGPDKRENG